MIGICILSLLMSKVAVSTNLSSVYTNDFQLTVENSPYFVISDVEIRESSSWSIENGVEITFMDDYNITILGNINGGCYNYDTSSITDINGLANDINFTYIHGDTSKTRIGKIYIDHNSNKNITDLLFCNTLFSNLDIAVHLNIVTNNNNNYIDNCYFNDNNYAIYVDDAGVSNTENNGILKIYDNKMNLSYSSSSWSTAIYINNHRNIDINNNYFVDGGEFIEIREENSSNINITNNNFDKGSGSIIELYSAGSSILINNNNFYNNVGNAIIRMLGTNKNGVKGNNDEIQIKYNNFYNNMHTFTGGACFEIFSTQFIDIEYNNVYNNYFYQNVFVVGTSGSYANYLNIRYNNFTNNSMDNNGDSLLHLQSVQGLVIEYNNFVNNKGIYRMLSRMSSCDFAQIQYNNFIGNEYTKLLYLTFTSNMSFLYNNFENNIINGYDKPTLLTIYYVESSDIKYNQFISNLDDTSVGIVYIMYITNGGYNNIEFNTFNSPNSSYYVFIKESVNPHYIHYNNFYVDSNGNDTILNPDYFIGLDSVVNINADLNYFDDNLVDKFNKINDFCDNLNDGMVIFWPWYNTAILGANLPDSQCSFNSVSNCSFGNVVCQSPTDEPSTSSPTTIYPTSRYPTTAYPTTTSPTTAHPTTTYPTTTEPTTTYPTTAYPTTTYPTNTAQPTTTSPTTANPTSAEETTKTSYPTTVSPTNTAQPTTSEPTTSTTTEIAAYSTQETPTPIAANKSNRNNILNCYYVLLVIMACIVC